VPPANTPSPAAAAETTTTRWNCPATGVARSSPPTGPVGARPSHIALTNNQIAGASRRLVLHVDDNDGLALLLWPAQVFLRWPGGAMPVLARVLVEELLRMLDRLHHAGFLNPDPAGGNTLTIPAMPPDQTDPSDVIPR
jgi:hypothetical protein